MISVYYNQKYGFLIVPNAIERFMGCYISIEPTIEIMAEETIDKIGCAIRKGIKIAESSPKVDESQLNNFWKQTKYKSFPTFSKNYQRIDLKQNGDELEIRRWERNNRGGYSRKTEEKDYINLLKKALFIISHKYSGRIVSLQLKTTYAGLMYPPFKLGVFMPIEPTLIR